MIVDGWRDFNAAISTSGNYDEQLASIKIAQSRLTNKLCEVQITTYNLLSYLVLLERISHLL